MVFGGVLALLVAQIFGKNTKTDAFFAAYGVYAVGLTFGQTFRLTAVSRLVQARGAEPITRLLGAVVILALILGIPMVALADPLGRLLVTTDPGNVAPAALRILWIALTGQLLAAMLATVLAVRGRFVAIGLASLLSGFVSIGTFLLVESSLGIPGAAVGLAASAVWLTTAFALVLARTGWRPTLPTLRSVHEMALEAVRLAFASSIFIGMTLAYVICVAMAARQGRGEATLFAYAYVLAAMLVGVTANVTAMVRSPALVASRDRARDASAAGVWSLRFTLLLAGPVLAMVLLVGKPVIAAALGSGFAGRDVHKILVTLACLVGWILGSAGGIFATVELLARSELRRLAALAVLLVVAVFALALIGAALAGIEGIAIALSTATLAVTVAQLRSAFGAEWHTAARRMLSACVREVAVLVVAFTPSILLLRAVGEGTVTTVLAAALAAAFVTIASRLAWPHESKALLGLARRSPDQPGQLLPDGGG